MWDIRIFSRSIHKRQKLKKKKKKKKTVLTFSMELRTKFV